MKNLYLILLTSMTFICTGCDLPDLTELSIIDMAGNIPLIEVFQNGQSVEDTAVDFGIVTNQPEGQESETPVSQTNPGDVEIIFSVTNSGNKDLVLWGSPFIEIISESPLEGFFSVTNQPEDNIVSPEESLIFSITFMNNNTNNEYDLMAEITIEYNGAESPLLIPVYGKQIDSEIVIY